MSGSLQTIFLHVLGIASYYVWSLFQSHIQNNITNESLQKSVEWIYNLQFNTFDILEIWHILSVMYIKGLIKGWYP